MCVAILFFFPCIILFTPAAVKVDVLYVKRPQGGARTRTSLRVNPERLPLQDFESNSELKSGVMGLLEEVLRDPDLLPQERKATSNILRRVPPTVFTHHYYKCTPTAAS